MVCRDSKVGNFADFLFLLLIIIRCGLRAEIRWSVCISKSHRSLCWVVHIPFVGMVKFKFLAHFPVDHLAYPVMFSLVLLLCQLLLLLLLLLFHSLWVLQIGVSWWRLSVFCVTASFLRSPELFSVFWDAVVSMAPIQPPISNSSIHYTKPLGTVPSTPNIDDINITTFLVLWQDQCTCLFLQFLKFFSGIHRDGKIHYTDSSLFLFFFFFC